MTRSERRLLIRTTILGVLLTLLVAAIDFGGLLSAPERYFYDLRARHCQVFTPPPTKDLVHLDIDDRSLEVIGRWPWPRSTLAKIVDELRIAGVKAIGWDVVFSEPQPLSYRELAALNPDLTQQDITSETLAEQLARSHFLATQRIDNDAVFAKQLREFGRSIVPVSLNLGLAPPTAPVYTRMVDLLTTATEKEVAGLVDDLKAQGFKDSDLAQQVQLYFVRARREAMYRRIEMEVRGGAKTLAQLRSAILKQTDAQITGSPVIRLLEAEYGRYQNVKSLRAYARPIGPDLPPLVSTRDEQAPLAIFTKDTGGTAFVDYVPMSDGIVRTVPLWANHRDFAFPQIGLALACRMLDVDPENVRIEEHRIVIPCPDGRQISVPVHRQKTPYGEYGAFFDIPWFGKPGSRSWETMYDPESLAPRQHMAISFVWEAANLRDRTTRNIGGLDDPITFLLSCLPDGRALAAKYAANPLDSLDFEGRKSKLQELTGEITRRDGVLDTYRRFEKQLLAATDEESKADLSKYLRLKELLVPPNWALTWQRTSGVRAESQLDRHIAAIASGNRDLTQALNKRRGEIRDQLHGRAILVGYIAVAALADFVPTSLHPRCPGVVVHGVIFNSIMTGEFWYAVPRWVTLLITIGMGLIATLIVSRLTAWKALLASAVLMGAYLLLNGIYLFDKHNLIVGVSGPLFVVAAVWSGGTLARYIIEVAERARVTRRFRNYVDPALVDYSLESDEVRFDGQEKEMSVVFTDLAGFTTISETLKEKTVPLLNEYMGLMVPIVRKKRGVYAGVLNKFLGDGIMYYFGAPFDNPNHARDAVESALEMQEAMVAFNEALTKRGLPTLSLRVGISSDRMIVGDTGPADGSASDYTAIGDAVNLGSRLEGANKVFGTRILVNDRAHVLAKDQFLFRPLGRIQVKGKHEGVMTYEALAKIEAATDAHKKLAEMTAAIVTPFMSADFKACLSAIELMESLLGASKFTLFYRGLCEQYLRVPPAGGFDGQIVLTEK